MVQLEPLWIEWPSIRIRRELDVDRGTVTRFVVQLEYNIATVADVPDPTWRVVARFDHGVTTPGGHDVTEGGLHLDIYRDGERYERLRGFPKLPAGQAMRYGEEYLRRHAERLLARFERWHALPGPWNRD